MRQNHTCISSKVWICALMLCRDISEQIMELTCQFNASWSSEIFVRD